MASEKIKYLKNKDGEVRFIKDIDVKPKVIIGRCVRPQASVGQAFLFLDGLVKVPYKTWNSLGYDTGDFDSLDTSFYYLSSIIKGNPILFTIPADFDYSKMNSADYVKQYCTWISKEECNFETTSPYYKVVKGNIICIKPIVLDRDYMGYINPYVNGNFTRSRRLRSWGSSGHKNPVTGEARYESLHRYTSNGSTYGCWLTVHTSGSKFKYKAQTFRKSIFSVKLHKRCIKHYSEDIFELI